MRDFCILNLQGYSCAMEFQWLSEVIEPLPVTPVPLAPLGLRGVVNLRGELVPVVALDPILGLANPDNVVARRPWMAVFRYGLHSLGILTSGVGTVRGAEVAVASGEQGEDCLTEGVLTNGDAEIPVLNFKMLLQTLSEGGR